MTTPAEVLAERTSKALRYARFGDEEGEHHKVWVIDQMVRALTGCGDEGESDMYRAFTAITPLDPGIAP